MFKQFKPKVIQSLGLRVTRNHFHSHSECIRLKIDGRDPFSFSFWKTDIMWKYTMAYESGRVTPQIFNILHATHTRNTICHNIQNISTYLRHTFPASTLILNLIHQNENENCTVGQNENENQHAYWELSWLNYPWFIRLCGILVFHSL